LYGGFEFSVFFVRHFREQLFVFRIYTQAHRVASVLYTLLLA
jgi:hypothetical protein